MNIKQVRSEGLLGKQGFQYDIKKLLEPSTKTVDKASEKLHEQSVTTAAIENADKLSLGNGTSNAIANAQGTVTIVKKCYEKNK